MTSHPHMNYLSIRNEEMMKLLQEINLSSISASVKDLSVNESSKELALVHLSTQFLDTGDILTIVFRSNTCCESKLMPPSEHLQKLSDRMSHVNAAIFHFSKAVFEIMYGWVTWEYPS